MFFTRARHSARAIGDREYGRHINTVSCGCYAAVDAGMLSCQPGSAVLIIDPQVDFHPGGALPVKGADLDAKRIHDFILSNLDNIGQIFITLDSHQRNHIGHGLFWRDEKGDRPAPFTVITHQDVLARKWVPTQPDLQAYAEEYTRRLEEQGRFQHCIWPEHCLIGSPGHCVYPPILQACHAWVERSGRSLSFTWKGTNTLTEMYSVFQADVPVPSDPSTGLNKRLVESLAKHPKVYICGQALSHCVNFSTRDLVACWPPARLGDLVLLTDMCSPVGGFEEQAEQFVDFVRAQGVQALTSTSTAGDADQEDHGSA